MQAGGGEMYFGYGETELQYLRSRDKRIGEVIDRVGMIRREVDPDLFAAVVHHIVGQQISTKAQATVWRRMQEALGTVDAGSVLAAGPEGLQALGISGRKAATSRTLPPGSERSLRPGDGTGEQRCGGHPAAVYPEGRGGVDGGDDPAVLPAKTGYFQL